MKLWLCFLQQIGRSVFDLGLIIYRFDQSHILKIENQNLTGEIPVEFTQLKSLSALALGMCCN